MRRRATRVERSTRSHRPRAAIVSRWRDAVDSGTNALLNRTESGQSAAVSAAHTALQTVDQMLTQSSGRLCDDHMLRHKALRLRVYALNLIPSGVDAELAEAIEKCVEGMSLHLPPYHPELAFYRFWHAKALTKQAGGGSCGKSAQKALQKRAAEARRRRPMAWRSRTVPTTRRSASGGAAKRTRSGLSVGSSSSQRRDGV